MMLVDATMGRPEYPAHLQLTGLVSARRTPSLSGAVHRLSGAVAVLQLSDACPSAVCKFFAVRTVRRSVCSVRHLSVFKTSGLEWKLNRLDKLRIDFGATAFFRV